MFKYLAAFTPSYMTGGCNIRKRWRNHEISQKYQGGSSIASLAMQFSLSEKSIQRIVREGKRKSGKL